jgi:hypothetical protein
VERLVDATREVQMVEARFTAQLGRVQQRIGTAIDVANAAVLLDRSRDLKGAAERQVGDTEAIWRRRK